MPIDAERWLASRGVEREPLVGDGAPLARSPEQVPVQGPEPGVREVIGLARQAAAEPEHAVSPALLQDAPMGGTNDADDVDGQAREGSAGVGSALAFIHRSTANAPQSEGRLRAKLSERGYPGPVVDEALAEARAQRLVDDAAMLAALITERRSRGHADPRLRRDLRDRGFAGLQVDEALALHAHTDPVAAAFALARELAARHRSVDAEVAVRRTIGHLVRRGHSEGLARKAARDAVYADREVQVIAGR
ncbi:MAG: RecX family transcriptional regulator [Actinomycetota bacterium]|nr:RecX family transcriptional regulator [Actinomycetota bacterium]